MLPCEPATRSTPGVVPHDDVERVATALEVIARELRIAMDPQVNDLAYAVSFVGALEVAAASLLRFVRTAAKRGGATSTRRW